MRTFYFGCGTGSGHHYRRRDSWRTEMDGHKLGLPWKHVDGKLNPSEREGEAALYHKDGWTALAFADRSVDTRPGSNSVFFFGAVLSFEQAVRAACDLWPQQMERLNVHPYDVAQGRVNAHPASTLEEGPRV